MKKEGIVFILVAISILLISVSLVSAESNETEIGNATPPTNETEANKTAEINVTETNETTNETEINISEEDEELADMMPKAGITPDSVLYGADVFLDNAKATLTPTSLGKSKVRLEIMQERMAEMDEMANKNKTTEAKKAQLEAQKQMKKFEGSTERVKKKDAMKLNEHIQSHAEILEILKQRFEDFGQPDYTDAIAEAIKMLEELEGIIINIPENLSPDSIFIISASCQEAGATTAEECNELIKSGLLTAPPRYCTPDKPCDDLPSYPAQAYPCTGGGSYWNYKTKWCCDDSDGLYSPEYIAHLRSTHEEGMFLDMLNYYYRKGTVEYKIITIKTGEAEEGIERDSCDGDTLTEWVCPTTMSMVTRNERYSEEYVCPYGCEDGACIICNSDSICDQPNEDCSCSDCEGKRNGCDYAHVCQNGECVCQNGECVQGAPSEWVTKEEFEGECADSDGGRDYYVKGTVVGKHQTTGFTQYHIDTCIDDKKLAEGFCGDNNGVSSISYSCPNGCQDGVCIR
ncbi:MAG: DUF5667 domain-containing protein [archaeon]